MVDFFLALMLPGAGDELQGIKKGIVELADMIAINKADGENRLRAEQARRHYVNALRIIEPSSPSWRPPVVTVSGLTGEGIDLLWNEMLRHRQMMEASGDLQRRRREQQVRWFWSMLDDRLTRLFRGHPRVAQRLPKLEQDVAAGSITPVSAVQELICAFGIEPPPSQEGPG